MPLRVNIGALDDKDQKINPCRKLHLVTIVVMYLRHSRQSQVKPISNGICSAEKGTMLSKPERELMALCLVFSDAEKLLEGVW